MVHHPTSQLRRDVRLLRAYVAMISLPLLFVSLSAFRRSDAPSRLDELDVQRINVREPDGKLRMVLSNRARSTGPIARGQPFGYPGGSRPGIIFFNDEETENGGLVFEGKTVNGARSAGAQLSFDQYEQDQVVTLSYDDEAGVRTMGLAVTDRPDTTAGRRPLGVPMSAPRVFVGRDPARAAVLRLSDPLGRVRLRLIVDSLGAARIEFLDGRGRIIQQLPAVTAPDTTRRQN